MAQITITIPDAQVPRIRAAFASIFGKPFLQSDIKEWLVADIMRIVKLDEANTAIKTARAAAEAKVVTEIAIT